MSQWGPITSRAGLAKVLYFVATASEPVTTADVAAALDVSKSQARGQLRRLWKSYMVVRRKIQNGHYLEYEYALAPREVSEE